MEDAATSFTVLLDRSLHSSAVALTSWCPTMDLLAMVNSLHELQVHRLNWQRLWSVGLPSAPTALVWRPDGKQLIVAFDLGGFWVLNVDDGSQARCVPPELDSAGQVIPVRALDWTSLASPFPPFPGCELRARQHLPPPPAPPTDSPDSDARACPPSWPPLSPSPSLVSTLSADGWLRIYTPELVLLSSASVGAAIGEPGVGERGNAKNWAVSLSPTAADIAVCLPVLDSSPRAALARLRCSEVSRSASSALVTSQALLDLREGSLPAARSWLDQARADWEAGRSAWNGLVASMAQAHRDCLETDPPEAHLQDLLATGRCSPGLHHALGVKCTAPALLKAAAALRQGALRAHAALASGALPALELAAFQLAELRGWAACREEESAAVPKGGPPAGCPLPLCARLLDAAERAALEAARAGLRLQERVLKEGRARARAAEWLAKEAVALQSAEADAAAQPLEEEAVEEVLELLEGGLAHSEVAEALRELEELGELRELEELGERADAEQAGSSACASLLADAARELLSSAPCLARMAVLGGPLPSPPACLARVWKLLGTCVERAVVPLVRGDPLLSLHWIPPSTTPLSLARPPDSDALQVFLGQGRRALVLQHSLEAAAQLEALDWTLPGELAACAPFKPDLVALLWRRGGGGCCLALVETQGEDYAPASLDQRATAQELICAPQAQLYARGAEAWAAAEERARRRDLEGGKEGEDAPGLALSASRGLACLVFGKKRTLLLDMSADEDEEEE